MTSKVTITINTEKDAFNSEPSQELARVLRELADKIEQDTEVKSRWIRDINGNIVGQLAVS